MAYNSKYTGAQVEAILDKANTAPTADDLASKADKLTTGSGYKFLNDKGKYDVIREGNSTRPSGESSHAEGHGTSASGPYSHSEGYATTASNSASHAEGNFTEANGDASHAEGRTTITQNFAEHAEGQCNKSNKAKRTFGDAGNTLHSVGMGTLPSARKNAHEIMQNGDQYIYGIGGYDGTNPSSAESVQQVINGLQEKVDGMGASEVEDIYPDVERLIPCFAFAGTDYNNGTITGTLQAGKRLIIPCGSSYIINLPDEARYDNKEYRVTIYDGNSSGSLSLPNWANKFKVAGPQTNHSVTSSFYGYRHDISFVNGVGVETVTGGYKREGSVSLIKISSSNLIWTADRFDFVAPWCYLIHWHGTPIDSTSDVAIITLGPFKMLVRQELKTYTIDDDHAISYFEYTFTFKIGDVTRVLTLSEGIYEDSDNPDNNKSESFTDFDLDWYIFYNDGKYHTFIKIFGISDDSLVPDGGWSTGVSTDHQSLNAPSTVGYVEKTGQSTVLDNASTSDFELIKLTI